ncbi:MAG: N-acetylmuramate alpha-1-phosphate uridylyltransferase MurU [Nevskiales bacterium]
MLLAAGRGERMRPHTDTLPKSLLPLRGKPLIVYHLEKLAAAGVREVVINTGWLGEKIPVALGDGSAWELQISYSHEGWPALETGGGIKRALPLLGTAAFLVINADVYSDYPYANLAQRDVVASDLAHLVLTANPPHYPAGDFALEGQRVRSEGRPRHTYTGIGLFRPELFQTVPEEAFSWVPLLREAMRRDRVAGEMYTGFWRDIGTPQRLAELRGVGSDVS